MGDITKMEVWRSSLELASNIYELTRIGAFSRDFTFRDQIRRSAISIPSNIAEGLESGFDRLGIRYFYNAKGSAAELKTQIMLAAKIDYLETSRQIEIIKRVDSIVKMLNKLIAYRKRKIKE